uniref:Uncharacterized protein n=1 Tax=Glossina palpalis gambiensis TaxID=67801 RepID=A0A1B0BWI5_9MUSC
MRRLQDFLRMCIYYNNNNNNNSTATTVLLQQPQKEKQTFNLWFNGLFGLNDSESIAQIKMACTSSHIDLTLIFGDIIASLVISSKIGILLAIAMSLLFMYHGTTPRPWNFRGYYSQLGYLFKYWDTTGYSHEFAQSIAGSCTNSCKNLRKV